MSGSCQIQVDLILSLYKWSWYEENGTLHQMQMYLVNCLWIDSIFAISLIRCDQIEVLYSNFGLT